MGRTLRYLGLGALACAAWALIAAEAGWIDRATSEAWLPGLVRGGAICFVAGLVFGAIGPGVRWLRRGHCARCGAPTERGQTYCLDHLRATVHEAQDQVRAAADHAPRRP